MQFSVNGVPVDGSAQEVPQAVTTIGIYIAPDSPVESFCADLFATGPWVAPEPLPELDDLIASGDVRHLGDWANEYAYAGWFDGYDEWSICGFLDMGPTSEPQVVAEFDVDLSGYPVSTVLNLEFSLAEIGIEEADVAYPLLLHVAPEPASLGLLALGVLAAIRRRR
jgi:hypothetical protein